MTTSKGRKSETIIVTDGKNNVLETSTVNELITSLTMTKYMIRKLINNKELVFNDHYGQLIGFHVNEVTEMLALPGRMNPYLFVIAPNGKPSQTAPFERGKLSKIMLHLGPSEEDINYSVRSNELVFCPLVQRHFAFRHKASGRRPGSDSRDSLELKLGTFQNW